MDTTRPLIAVVDDEESVCRAIQRLLTSSGLDVITFATGQNLLDSLSSQRPDCLILDLHMPEMSGFDIQSRLAEAKMDIPVVAITGHDTPEAKAKVLAAGAAAYLRKPVMGNVLLDAIKSAIKRR